MYRYVVGRLLQGICALFVASIAVFGLARLSGNPVDVMLGEDATLEDREILVKHFGLDKPLLEQYWLFISHAARGDLGNSVRYRKPVIDFILTCAPATIKLTCLSMLISILIAVPAGVLGAIRRDRWQDSLGKAIAISGQSVPLFWLGIVLIQLFSVGFGVLPAGGMGDFRYWILPAATLGCSSTAGILRFTRSAMLDVVRTDYVRLARIKGVRERSVVWKHALRNALIPVVTFLSILFARKLMGSVVVETVFAWPGLGRLAYQSVMSRDFPMMQGIILMYVGIFLFVNLLVDILYCYLDPRIRYVKE